MKFLRDSIAHFWAKLDWVVFKILKGEIVLTLMHTDRNPIKDKHLAPARKKFKGANPDLEKLINVRVRQ